MSNQQGHQQSGGQDMFSMMCDMMTVPGLCKSKGQGRSSAECKANPSACCPAAVQACSDTDPFNVFTPACPKSMGTGAKCVGSEMMSMTKVGVCMCQQGGICQGSGTNPTSAWLQEGQGPSHPSLRPLRLCGPSAIFYGPSAISYDGPIAISSAFAPCVPQSSLSKRQRRRRFETLYWHNVHISAVLRAERIRRRRDQMDERVFSEYQLIVEEEAKSLQKEKETPRYVDVCLVDAMRALSFKVPYTGNGPFWALADGSCFVKPWGQRLNRVQEADLSASADVKLVVHSDSHFIAVRCLEGAWQVNFTNKTHKWQDTVLTRRAEDKRSFWKKGNVWMINLSTVSFFQIVPLGELGSEEALDCAGGMFRALGNGGPEQQLDAPRSDNVEFVSACTGAHICNLHIPADSAVISLKQQVAMKLQHLPFSVVLVAEGTVLALGSAWSGCFKEVGVILTKRTQGFAQDLAEAIQLQKLELVIHLLELGQEPNCYGFAQSTQRLEAVLLFAAGIGYFYSTHLLLEAWADPNSAGNDRRTALRLAVCARSPTTVETLLWHGADVHAQDWNGEMPLHFAALNEDVPIVKQLLLAGADPLAPDAVLDTALLWAYAADTRAALMDGCWRNMSFSTLFLLNRQACPRCVRALLLDGQDPSCMIVETALSIAVVRGHKEIVGVVNLIPPGVPHAPLHHAVIFGSIRICQQLLQAKADPSLPDRGGCRPIHYALIAEELLCWGADPMHRDVDDDTGFSMAVPGRLTSLCLTSCWNRASRGTWMHASFECLLNGGFIATNDDELKLLGAKVFRTEWTVYATEEDLAGSIDLAMQLPDQSLILVDWKRTQQLSQRSCGFGRRMAGCLATLPDATL
eukprot:symbB.v1.2.012392.t1/scaffold857.1/size218589/7